MADDPGDVTRILKRCKDGGREALDELFPLVYDELRRIAGRHFRREQPGSTLQPTALVHEAYFRLVGQRDVEWQSRAHFYAVAARIMRRVLTDAARARRAAKRGGALGSVTLDEERLAPAERAVDLVALDDALGELERVNAEWCRVVELRYFGGLEIAETAEVLGVSPATVKRTWTAARTWLFRELRRA